MNFDNLKLEAYNYERKQWCRIVALDVDRNNLWLSNGAVQFSQELNTTKLRTPIVEAQNTPNNKQMVSALWKALGDEKVRKIGYDNCKSEWVPVNIERLNAAWDKANESSALHH